VPVPQARSSWRHVALLLALAWLAIGLFGAYLYTHRYQLYRGFPAPVTPAGVARGSVRNEYFDSAALGGRHRYLVYLPPHYAARAARGARFPVLYLLHGDPGSPEVFTRAGALAVQADVLLSEHRIKPMIFVMPSGKGGLLQAGTEWANAQSGPYESYVLDVVHDVDRRFATVPERQGRGIGGLSEGGFGALNISLHHLNDFSVAESWSGYFNETRTGAFSHATTAQIRANSPAQYVATLSPEIHRLGYRAWIYQGQLDSRPESHIRNFSAALHAAGAEVHYGFFPGGHDWGLWRAQLPRMLTAASAWFARSPRSGTPGFSGVGHAGSAAAIRRYEIRRRELCLRRRAARRAAGKPPGHLCQVIRPLARRHAPPSG
jgi:enterochelin esterase-like enzyme